MGLRGRKKLKAVRNVCHHCKKVFFGDDHHHRNRRDFCSVKCLGLSKRTGEQRICKECGDEFYYSNWLSRGRHKGKFCSRKCVLENWIKKSLANDSPSVYQKTAWNHFERKCYDCGLDAHPKLIVIHHKDGNRQNGKLKNLIPVCHNCHCLRHIKMNDKNYRMPSWRG